MSFTLFLTCKLNSRQFECIPRWQQLVRLYSNFLRNLSFVGLVKQELQPIQHTCIEVGTSSSILKWATVKRSFSNKLSDRLTNGDKHDAWHVKPMPLLSGDVLM